MATPNDLSWISELPPFAQGIVTVVFAIGAGAVLLRRYFQQEIAPQPSSRDVVLTGGSIADMTPVREAVAEMKALNQANGRCAVALERIATSLEQAADERRDEREIEERAKALAKDLLEQAERDRRDGRPIPNIPRRRR